MWKACQVVSGSGCLVICRAREPIQLNKIYSRTHAVRNTKKKNALDVHI